MWLISGIYRIFKIAVESWETEKYDTEMAPVAHEYDLNPNTGLLVCSDYPVILDIIDYEHFMSEERTVHLFLYDFKNQDLKIIDTSKNESFDPVWIDDNSIEYNNPNGEGRVIYQLVDNK